MKRKQTTDPVHYVHYPQEGFPQRVFYKWVAGPRLHPIQMYDVVFDTYDLKIRKLI